MSQPTPYWESKPKYDGGIYDLTHLQPWNTTILVPNIPSTRSLAGPTKVQMPICFKFSYHCCTDKDSASLGLGDIVVESERPEEKRRLCPVRWFISQSLKDTLRKAMSKDLAPIHNYQWVLQSKVPGLSHTWVTILKFMPGPAQGCAIASVETSYLTGSPTRGGTPESFAYIAQRTRKLGQLYGVK